MLRLHGKLPSLKEFWSYRIGISAVNTAIALNEYDFVKSGHVETVVPLSRWYDVCRFAFDANGLPNSVMENDDMKLVWNLTNIIVST